jgi:hypothetical protein
VRTARQEGIQRLYHYQGPDLEHVRDTLINSRVRCSNPEQLNDPWDCRVYFDDLHLDDASARERWGKLMDAEFAKLPAKEQAKITEGGISWYDNRAFVERVVAGINQEVWKKIAEGRRIYCLTPHPNLLLMWAHYGNRHAGICLEFDASRELGRAYKVIYLDDMPVIDADRALDGRAMVDAGFLTNSSEWRYEDEYRLVMTIDEPSPPALRTEGDYLFLPPGTLTGIVVGHDAKAEEIRALVQECHADVRLKRAVRRPHQYHLDIVDDIAV